MGFWGFGEQSLAFMQMYLVQLRIAPQNPKTPQIITRNILLKG